MRTDATRLGLVYTLEGKRVWVAGHSGMVGSALVRRLATENCKILTASRADLDLKRQADVETWIGDTRPQAIFLAAAKVGGILANDRSPADFLYDNLIIQTNIIEAAYRCGVEKLLLLGSSCIYPKFARQPITEDALLSGPLEPTNEAYAIAKIAGVKLGQAYRRQHHFDVVAAMPTNLYGPGDNFNLTTSHVMPALIRKAHEAKLTGQDGFEIWGTGDPRREFLYVDDCADAVVHLMKSYSEDEHINVGSGKDITIHDLAKLVADVVGFDGDIYRNVSKPDGTPRKLMSADKLIAQGWRPSTSLRHGINMSYRWFLSQEA